MMVEYRINRSIQQDTFFFLFNTKIRNTYELILIKIMYLLSFDSYVSLIKN